MAVRLSQVERSLGAHGAQSTAGGGPRWYGFSYAGFFSDEGVLAKSTRRGRTEGAGAPVVIISASGGASEAWLR